MKIKNKLIILFLFILFLFLFNTDSFCYENDFTEVSEEDFINHISTCYNTYYQYPFSTHFFRYFSDPTTGNTYTYDATLPEFDNSKYRLVYFFTNGESSLKLYMIYSDSPLYVTYEYGDSTPIFRITDTTNITYVTYDCTPRVF